MDCIVLADILASNLMHSVVHVYDGANGTQLFQHLQLPSQCHQRGRAVCDCRGLTVHHVRTHCCHQ